jgi:predicted RNase H-like HicB family nuclease
LDDLVNLQSDDYTLAMTNKSAATREFNVVVERDEVGWYVASVPALPGCHTQARSLDELMSRIREAIEACLEAGDAPAPLEFVGVQRVSVAA